MKKTVFLLFALAISFSLNAKPKLPKVPKIPGVKNKIIKELENAISTEAERAKEEEKTEEQPVNTENKKSIKEIKQDLFTYISEDNTEKISAAIDMIEQIADNDEERRISCFYTNEKTGEEEEWGVLDAALMQDRAGTAVFLQRKLQYANYDVHGWCATYNAVKCYAALKEEYGDDFTYCKYQIFDHDYVSQLPYSIINALKNENENILQAMLADLNDADDHVLAYCAYKGRKDIFDILLTKKFNPEKSNALILCAALTNDTYYYKKLISLGVDVNKRCYIHPHEFMYDVPKPFENELIPSNGAAIDFAAFNNSLDSVKYLEKFGATARVVGFSYDPPSTLKISIIGNAPDTTTYLLNKDERDSFDLREAFRQALKYDSEKIVPLLHKQGLKLSSESLYDAVTYNAVNVIPYLVKNGCNINDPAHPALVAALTASLRYNDREKKDVIEERRENLVKLLISLGAKVDLKYQDGSIALTYANTAKMRQLLMEHME